MIMSIIRLDTIVTDVLSAIGLFIIVFSPLFFSRIQKKVLNQRLHTKIDGEKLFEKLKYDLKLSKLTGVNKRRLYIDPDYAKTIFRGAMEYNNREFIWYFNELFAKMYIHNSIWKKAIMHTWIWILAILVIVGGSYADIGKWLFDMQNMNSNSGIVSIWILFICAAGLSALIKYMEFIKVKKVINDEVRQINLTKKEKVWKDYLIIYWISCGTPFLGFMLILINIFFV
ncbi:hypothetical protein [Spiroplasma diminutum]|uniref:Transmembrane protein n=1 Tax=Spiroplasma diminutum CUAS-1 TaxID=1276221 RepID=S5M2I1_9MOLU|nr:hypothetical protein [Spiroplasma diminutum]AGR42292.1 hypothetical protein SDIMI_v3c05880 [Spiroplasma diminutum CUAS-1]